MARGRKGTPPSHCLQKQSAQAVFNWLLGGGRYRSILLGKHGTPESHAEYERVLAEWRASSGAAMPSFLRNSSGPPDQTLYEIALAFDKYARQRYRHPNGEETGEARNFKDALMPLLELYGHTVWREFGPNALRAVQTKMVMDGSARKTVNARINRIRRFFKWAVGREMIPGSLHLDLQTVEPLRKGQTLHVETDEGMNTIPIKESPGVHDIDWKYVKAILPFLCRPVAAMVQIMRISNGRAEDVVTMRSVLTSPAPGPMPSPCRHPYCPRAS